MSFKLKCTDFVTTACLQSAITGATSPSVVSVIASSGSGGVLDVLQTVTSSSSTVVPVEFNVVQQDDLGIYNPTTFTWTIPVDGVYSLSYTLCWNPIGSLGAATNPYLIGAAWEVVRGGAVLNEHGKDLRSIGPIGAQPLEVANVRTNNSTVVVPLRAGDELRVLAALQGGPTPPPAGTMDILATAAATFPGSTLATTASVYRI